MRKVGLLVIAALLVMPVAAMSATDKDAADDQSLVAASYQQGESAIDPSAPVTKPTAAADIAESAAAMADAASSAPSAPTVTQSNDATPVSVSTAPAAPADVDSAGVTPLSQQVVDLHNTVSQLQQQGDQFRQDLNQIQYTVYGLTGLMVLLALLSLARRSKKTTQTKKAFTAASVAASSTTTVKVEDDTQGEYDFMGSSEGIPAKLDLARAYIAMEDFIAARETLAEILSEGNEQYRNEARSLLTKINT